MSMHAADDHSFYIVGLQILWRAGNSVQEHGLALLEVS